MLKIISKSSIKKNSLIAMLIIIIVFSTTLLSGCSIFFGSVSGIEFKSDIITVKVGEKKKIDLTEITFTPDTAKNKTFYLSSDNEEVLKTSKDNGINYIIGASVGSAIITATSSSGRKTATCQINVTLDEPLSIKIIPSGNLIQNISNLSTIDFLADFDGVMSPSKKVDWNISNQSTNESANKEKTASEVFSFTPTVAGKFAITASIVDSLGSAHSHSVEVNIYNDYIKAPELVVDGNLVQEQSNYSAVNFLIDYEDNAQNLARVIEWVVNEEVVSNSRNYVFTPVKAGVYNVLAFIDGVLLNESIVTAMGNITPQNIRFDTDNCYPKVILYWDETVDNMQFEVEVSGGKISAPNLSTTNVENKTKFITSEKNPRQYIGVDLSSYFTGANLFDALYTAKVKTLGTTDGSFKASEYSSPVNTTKYTADAKLYLSNKIYSDGANGGAKNLYLTDDNEFYEFFAYMFLWRSNPRNSSQSSSTDSETVYFAFPFDESSLSTLISDAYSLAHFTGMASIGYSQDRFKPKLVTVIIEFQTDALPSISQDKTSANGGMNAIRPHINYDKKLGDKRKNNAILPIDSKRTTVQVSNSEQLYYMAQLGYKPVPVKGSEADVLYQNAKEVLYYIITDDMTDVEKAHAIYDYIMWKVRYDHVTTKVTNLADSVKYNAYYLEGVLSDKYNVSLAVCDGMSKAYALLCNMEGIECIRIAGIGGSVDYDESKWGGHAWNKVKINNQWYIVDCTWGDETMTFADGVKYEMAFHKYFLLTDKEVERNRAEDQPNNYPRTATTSYNFYDDKVDYNGKEVDFYINTTANNAEIESSILVDYLVQEVTSGKTQYNKAYTVGGASAANSVCDYVAFEIKINNSLNNLFINTNNNPIVKAFSDKNMNLVTNTFLSAKGDYLYYYLQNFDSSYVYLFIKI